MKLSTTSLALLIACAFITVTPCAATAGDLSESVPDLTGAWDTLISDSQNVDYACMALGLYVQKNRSYFGLVGASFQPIDPCQPGDPCRLVISERGVVSIQSYGEGQMLSGHGQYFADELGEMMIMTFQVQYQDGIKDIGTVLLVR